MAIATGQINLQNINENIQVSLSKEAHIFAGTTTTAIAGSVVCDVTAFVGKTASVATVGTITGLPTGMTVTAPIANNGTTSPRITFNVTTAMVTPSGVLTIPVTVTTPLGGVLINKTFSYGISFKGAEAYTVILTNEAVVFPGDETKAIPGSSAVSNIIVYKGDTQIVSSVAVTGTPAGMTVAVANQGAITNNFTASIHATTPMVTKSGELTVTITADTKTFVKKFSFTFAVKGTNGSPGADGTNAKIVNIVPSGTSFTTNTISSDPAAFIYTPTSIVLTPAFQNCSYSKWEYSINGTNWTVIALQNGLTIDGSTKALTVTSTNPLFTTTQPFLIFKVTSDSGASDVVTLNRLFESGALGGRLASAESTITQNADSISLRVTSETTATKTELKNYIGSRGQNLVTNGTGLLGNNTNFSGFTFNGADAMGAAGSFASTISNTPVQDEFMPVDTSKNYRLSFYAKAIKGSPEKALTKHYSYVDYYDADKLSISAEMVNPFSNTLTTLAQDLKVGDTVVYLTNAANYWNNAGSSTHFRKFMFWGYRNSFGYLYPAGTYTRYFSTYDTWSDGAVDYVNNTITLRVPWTKTNPNDAQGIWRAGQEISNGTSGGYDYKCLINTEVPEVWTSYSAVFTPSSFRAGTAYVKIGWLNHYAAGQTVNTINNNTVMYSTITFGLDNASQEDINNIFSDNKLTPDEKQSLRRELDIIVAEKAKIDDQATTYTITTEKTNYGTSYTTLYNYLNPLLASLTTTSDVNGVTLRGYFADYTTKKELLVKKITDTAYTIASTAKAYTDNLGLDTVITPDEKLALKREWDMIVLEGTATTGKLIVQAASFAVVTQSYTTAFNALNTYLNTTLALFSAMTTAKTGIVRATWNTTWNNYYTARTDLLNAISTKAKSLADTAQSTVDNLQIGDKNILLNSGVAVTNATYNIQDYPLTEPIIAGETYTVALKGELGADRTWFQLYNSGGTFIECALIPANKGSDGVFYLTFTASVGTRTDEYIRVYQVPSGGTTESTIEWIKLVKGEKTSRVWMPSPEEIDQKIISAANDAVASSQASLILTDEAIRGDVNKTYLTKTELTTYQSTVGTSFTETYDAFNFGFTESYKVIDANKAKAEETFTEINKYIKFVGGNILLGESGNLITLKIQSNRVSFFSGTSEVAWFANNKLYVTDSEFSVSMRVGNFAFKPDITTGNLSFGKVT